MKRPKLLLVAGSIGTVLANLASGASAQQEAAYPNRAVRLIVPFPPGGGTDIVARTLGIRLGESLGQQIVVDNRGGAGGNIGAELAAKAAPDGYTLFMASATQAINVTLYGKLAYDLAKDFAPVSLVATLPYTLVCHPGLPTTSVKALVQLAKDKPGQLNYSSAGSGTGTHLAMEMFKTAAGISIVHIPYKGSAPAVTELLAGQVQLMFGNTASVLPQIKAGKLRALAHWGEKPLVSLPDVQSLKQAGYGASFAQWSALFVPAGTPDEVVQKLRAAAAKVAKDPNVIQTINRAGSPIEYLDAPDFQTYWDADAKLMTDAVRKIGKVE